MHAWEQIQKTIDYIELHLSEELDIDNLSKIAALSPFYYQRLFKRLVKKPVIEYIKLRRMAKAADYLLQSEKRILDIALDLGFSSHEQFTRTFKDTFGFTPDAYRKVPITLNRMTKPQLLLNYILIDENVPLITDGIVLEISRTSRNENEYFLGYQAKVPVKFVEGLGIDSGEDPLCILWDNLHMKKDSLTNLVLNGDELGVLYPCEEDGYFYYFAGAQATSFDCPEDMSTWELPSGEYIVCSFEAENFKGLVLDVLYKALQYLYGTWLPKHKIVTEPFSLERYAEHDVTTTKMEVWVKPIASN